MSTDDDFIDCKCPYCGEAMSFRADVVGLAEECPNCAESIVVPHESCELAGTIPLPIATPRLVLRRLAVADWQDLLEYLKDEQLFTYLEDAPASEQQILDWLDKDLLVKITRPNAVLWLGLELQPAATIIGNFSVSFNESRSQATITIYVSRNFQRQGFATEAANGVLDFCFDGIGLHRVAGSLDSRNTVAARVFEKVGMRREGEFLKDRFVNAEWVNTTWYAILEEDYRKSRSNPPRSESA